MINHTINQNYSIVIKLINTRIGIRASEIHLAFSRVTFDLLHALHWVEPCFIGLSDCTIPPQASTAYHVANMLNLFIPGLINTHSEVPEHD